MAMQQLIELIQRCAATAAAARPQDLSALAQLHTDLLSARPLAVGDAKTGENPAGPRIAESAEQTAALVEKVILSEVEDSLAGLKEVNRQIDELLDLIKGGGSSPQVPAAAPTASPVAAAAPAAVADEHDIKADDAPLALEFVGEAIGHLDAAEASLLKLEDDPTDMGEVNAVFRAFHTIKGVAGFLELKQIGALAHAAETLLDLARKGKRQMVGRCLDVVLEARDMMRQMVGAVEAAAKAGNAPIKQQGLAALLVRLASAARGEESPAAAATPSAETAKTAEAPAPPPATSTPTTGEAVIKVATGRLDTLIDAVGELVIAQAMVAQDLTGGASAADPRLARNLSHLGKITRGLQDISMSMRMVPIAAVFQKMARLTRDVARKAVKDVEFSQTGGETELDRNVVDAISDPLVHMVRNAIDHGLENPEDRLKAGKPRAGHLGLKAFHQAGNVVIEINDDGRGLNLQKIVQKAIATGVMREGQELSEQEIFQLIFHPGLSTAEKVTDISGRGVGMDVVRKNVEALRGRIEIASAPGKGSTFTVRLPLTLAVIDGLIVKVGTHRYIIPITSVEQNIRPTAAQLSSVGGNGEMCMVRDKLLPIVRLHRLFNVTPKTEDPTSALVVIVQDGPRRCCLFVDELIGQQQVVIKSIGKEIGHLPGIAGCAILGDGNVSLILDVAGIIHSALR
jgi:two-component system, chemotaxis family, sensor kinase CheA